MELELKTLREKPIRTAGVVQPQDLLPTLLTPPETVAFSGSKGQTVNGTDPIALGKRLYSANCATCHQLSGLGVPGKYPSLVGSKFVQSQNGWGPNHLVMILLNGLSGPISATGGPFTAEMPAHREFLKDQQIALILTYIRQEWGNKASIITTEDVAVIRRQSAARTQSWTEAELKAIPVKPSSGD